MKTAKDFALDSRVTHVNHGAGTVVAYDPFTDDGVFVEFDVAPDGWDKTLCVSAGCLSPLEEVK